LNPACGVARSSGVQISVPDDALVLFLRDRDVACPACRYSLRGIESKRCPECGIELRLQIAHRHATPFTWLAACFALSLTTLMSLMFAWRAFSALELAASDARLTMLIEHGLAPSPGTPNWSNLIIVVAAALIAIAAFAWLITARRMWLHLPLALRIGLALAAIASPLVLLFTLEGVIGFVV